MRHRILNKKDDLFSGYILFSFECLHLYSSLLLTEELKINTQIPVYYPRFTMTE